MEALRAYGSEAGTDGSFGFRVAAASLIAGGDESTLTDVFGAALALSEPSRSQALVAVLADALDAQVDQCAFGAIEALAEPLASILRSEQKLRSVVLTAVVDLHRSALAPSFRARLLNFLAAVFPPLDKSGLNMGRSIASASFVLATEPSDGGGESTGLVDELEQQEGLRLDYGLYTHFWRLQQAIAAGSGVLTQPAMFAAMAEACEAVLGAVQSCSGSAGVGNYESTSLGYYRTPEVLLAHFAPELDGGSFKLQLLGQLVMYLAHVEGQCSNETHRTAVHSLQKRVQTQLRALGPGSKTVQALVRGDRQWAAWRTAGASVPPLPEPVESIALPPRRQAAIPGEDSGSSGLGNAELSRLWAQEAPLGQGRRTPEVPSFESLVDQVLEEADPENDIEEQYQSRHKAMFQWKMMRIGLASSMEQLNHRQLFKADLLGVAKHVRQEQAEKKSDDEGEEEDDAQKEDDNEKKGSEEQEGDDNGKDEDDNDLSSSSSSSSSLASSSKTLKRGRAEDGKEDDEDINKVEEVNDDALDGKDNAADDVNGDEDEETNVKKQRAE